MMRELHTLAVGVLALVGVLGIGWVLMQFPWITIGLAAVFISWMLGKMFESAWDE